MLGQSPKSMFLGQTSNSDTFCHILMRLLWKSNFWKFEARSLDSTFLATPLTTHHQPPIKTCEESHPTSAGGVLLFIEPDVLQSSLNSDSAKRPCRNTKSEQERIWFSFTGPACEVSGFEDLPKASWFSSVSICASYWETCLAPLTGRSTFGQSRQEKSLAASFFQVTKLIQQKQSSLRPQASKTPSTEFNRYGNVTCERILSLVEPGNWGSCGQDQPKSHCWMGQFPPGSGSQSPQFIMKLRVESNHQRTVDRMQGVDEWMPACAYFLFPFCLFSHVFTRCTQESWCQAKHEWK